ncbi:MAG: type VI secretion system amidase effector protein Tae4 [Candidatus Thiodiazotropha sp.]
MEISAHNGMGLRKQEVGFAMTSFSKMWDNHPTGEFPCTESSGKKAYTNQCAIRMGVAFDKAGVSTKTFKGARCWHEHAPKHILRAEELAEWLKGPFTPFGKVETFEAASGFSRISGRTGVIFFKDYYGSNGQGDHIDLWNGSRLTKFVSWFDFLFMGGSHYAKATVWFWPVE